MNSKLLSPEQRKALILERLSAEEMITVAGIADSLSASEMTIRRDFSELERDGHLKRVHGGAVSSHGRGYEPPFTLRQSQAGEAKQRIAAAAAALVEEGDSVALDVGSTVLEVARQLAGRRALTVITPSIRVVNTLLHNKHIRLIVAGGQLRAGEESLVGELAQQAFAGLFVDKLFLGVGGLDARGGATEYNWDDALVKKAMIGSAKQVILTADASKFGRIAFAKVANFETIHTLVTDREPPRDLAARLAAAQVSVLVAAEARDRQAAS